MTLKTRFLAGCAAVILTATSAAASVLTLDSGWQEFDFGGFGSSWSTNFTFTLDDTAYLSVTDAFLSGDIFLVYSNAVLLGATSIVLPNGASTFDDYDTAFFSPDFSSTSFELAAGSYDITGLTIASPFGSGGAAIQLSTAPLTPASVPLPAGMPLLLAGLGAIGLVAKRRRKHQDA